MYAQRYYPAKPDDPHVVYSNLVKKWKSFAKVSGELICGHTMNVFARLGLLPSWLCHYRHLPEAKPTTNTGTLAKQFGYEFNESDAKYRSFCASLRIGVETGLGDKCDNVALEHAICKLARSYSSSSDKYRCYLIPEQSLYHFTSDNTVLVMHPHNSFSYRIDNDALINEWHDTLSDKSISFDQIVILFGKSG